MPWFILNWHYSLLLQNYYIYSRIRIRQPKKETQKATSMEFLDLCFTDSVDFSLYIQEQKLCQCQKEGNSSRHISAAVFSIKWQLKLLNSMLHCIGNRLLDKGKPHLEQELLRNRFWINNCLWGEIPEVGICNKDLRKKKAEIDFNKILEFGYPVMSQISWSWGLLNTWDNFYPLRINKSEFELKTLEKLVKLRQMKSLYLSETASVGNLKRR